MVQPSRTSRYTMKFHQLLILMTLCQVIYLAQSFSFNLTFTPFSSQFTDPLDNIDLIQLNLFDIPSNTELYLSLQFSTCSPEPKLIYSQDTPLDNDTTSISSLDTSESNSDDCILYQMPRVFDDIISEMELRSSIDLSWFNCGNDIRMYLSSYHGVISILSGASPSSTATCVLPLSSFLIAQELLEFTDSYPKFIVDEPIVYTITLSPSSQHDPTSSFEPVTASVQSVDSFLAQQFSYWHRRQELLQMKTINVNNIPQNVAMFNFSYAALVIPSEDHNIVFEITHIDGYTLDTFSNLVGNSLIMRYGDQHGFINDDILTPRIAFDTISFAIPIEFDSPWIEIELVCYIPEQYLHHFVMTYKFNDKVGTYSFLPKFEPSSLFATANNSFITWTLRFSLNADFVVQQYLNKQHKNQLIIVPDFVGYEPRDISLSVAPICELLTVHPNGTAVSNIVAIDYKTLSEPHDRSILSRGYLSLESQLFQLRQQFLLSCSHYIVETDKPQFVAQNVRLRLQQRGTQPDSTTTIHSAIIHSTFNTDNSQLLDASQPWNIIPSTTGVIKFTIVREVPISSQNELMSCLEQIVTMIQNATLPSGQTVNWFEHVSSKMFILDNIDEFVGFNYVDIYSHFPVTTQQQNISTYPTISPFIRSQRFGAAFSLWLDMSALPNDTNFDIIQGYTFPQLTHGIPLYISLSVESTSIDICPVQMATPETLHGVHRLSFPPACRRSLGESCISSSECRNGNDNSPLRLIHCLDNICQFHHTLHSNAFRSYYHQFNQLASQQHAVWPYIGDLNDNSAMTLFPSFSSPENDHSFQWSGWYACRDDNCDNSNSFMSIPLWFNFSSPYCPSDHLIYQQQSLNRTLLYSNQTSAYITISFYNKLSLEHVFTKSEYLVLDTNSNTSRHFNSWYLRLPFELPTTTLTDQDELVFTINVDLQSQCNYAWQAFTQHGLNVSLSIGAVNRVFSSFYPIPSLPSVEPSYVSTLPQQLFIGPNSAQNNHLRNERHPLANTIGFDVTFELPNTTYATLPYTFNLYPFGAFQLFPDLLLKSDVQCSLLGQSTNLFLPQQDNTILSQFGVNGAPFFFSLLVQDSLARDQFYFESALTLSCQWTFSPTLYPYIDVLWNTIAGGIAIVFDLPTGPSSSFRYASRVMIPTGLGNNNNNHANLQSEHKLDRFVVSRVNSLQYTTDKVSQIHNSLVSVSDIAAGASYKVLPLPIFQNFDAQSSRCYHVESYDQTSATHYHQLTFNYFDIGLAFLFQTDQSAFVSEPNLSSHLMSLLLQGSHFRRVIRAAYTISCTDVNNIHSYPAYHGLFQLNSTFSNTTLNHNMPQSLLNAHSGHYELVLASVALSQICTRQQIQINIISESFSMKSAAPQSSSQQDVSTDLGESIPTLARYVVTNQQQLPSQQQQQQQQPITSVTTTTHNNEQLNSIDSYPWYIQRMPVSNRQFSHQTATQIDNLISASFEFHKRIKTVRLGYRTTISLQSLVSSDIKSIVTTSLVLHDGAHYFAPKQTPPHPKSTWDNSMKSSQVDNTSITTTTSTVTSLAKQCYFETDTKQNINMTATIIDPFHLLLTPQRSNVTLDVPASRLTLHCNTIVVVAFNDELKQAHAQVLQNKSMPDRLFADNHINVKYDNIPIQLSISQPFISQNNNPDLFYVVTPVITQVTDLELPADLFVWIGILIGFILIAVIIGIFVYRFLHRSESNHKLNSSTSSAASKKSSKSSSSSSSLRNGGLGESLLSSSSSSSDGSSWSNKNTPRYAIMGGGGCGDPLNMSVNNGSLSNRSHDNIVTISSPSQFPTKHLPNSYSSIGSHDNYLQNLLTQDELMEEETSFIRQISSFNEQE